MNISLKRPKSKKIGNTNKKWIKLYSVSISKRKISITWSIWETQGTKKLRMATIWRLGYVHKCNVKNDKNKTKSKCWILWTSRCESKIKRKNLIGWMTFKLITTIWNINMNNLISVTSGIETMVKIPKFTIITEMSKSIGSIKRKSWSTDSWNRQHRRKDNRKTTKYLWSRVKKNIKLSKWKIH